MDRATHLLASGSLPDLDNLEDFSYLQEFLNSDAFSDSNPLEIDISPLDDSITTFHNASLELTPTSCFAVENDSLYLPLT
jgi:hypothetical protein